MASPARKPQRQQRQWQQWWSWPRGSGQSDAAADWPREPSGDKDDANTSKGKRSNVVSNGNDGDNGDGDGNNGNVVD